MSRDAESLSGYWRRQIFLLACRLNFGWWLDRFLSLFLVLSLLCMCALLMARRQGWPEARVWLAFGWALAPIAAAAFFWARRHFENRASARVRLEYALKLNNRLTAAEAGVGPWPKTDGEMPEILRWRWQPVLSLLAPALLMLLAGAYIYVPEDREKGTGWVSKPPALEQLESWVQTLEQNKLVEEKVLEELKQQVEQLSARPAEEWYSQGNLEASDHLKSQLKNQVQSLQKDLQAAAGALEKMQQEQPSLSESQMAQLSAKLAEALQGAQTGQLPLSSKFMENLPEIDPSKFKSLTPEQAKAMMGRLKQAGEALKEAGGDDGDPVMAMVMMEAGMPKPGGVGEVARGPGTVPLTLSADPSEVGSTKVEGMSNDDLSHAALGESVGISKGQHDGTPLRYEGAVAGGAAEQGSGGEAVWVNQLTPVEQAQVKSFFK